MSIPRILVAGLCGGSGKTLISLGLTAAWRQRGRKVAPFKKGPDYIDAAWLSRAADGPCRNIDSFLMPPQVVVRSFAASAGPADVAVIEGNRGLFDGMDARGTYSTAELAKLLQCPVVLAIDCTKMTRTVAALVLGCQRLDPQVQLRGVILNRTAGSRHESVLRDSVEQGCNLPVLGAMARMSELRFPERHLGLVPPQEHDQVARAIQHAADVAEQCLDLDAIWRLARQAPALEPDDPSPAAQTGPKPPRVRVGVFRDAAFQFYYPENLEALAREGASLTEVSPLRDAALPDVDALYIGGGFPETSAPALSANRQFLDSVCQAIERGMPVYAECGGAVFLGEKLQVDQEEYAMAGALPVSFSLRVKPQGHGYVELETVRENAFFPIGESLRGHEFHYTCVQSAAEDLTFAFRVRRGHGFDGRRDGLCYRNVLASYTHLHALGTECWAPSLIRAAEKFAPRASDVAQE
ncbi:MAG: cobyrinate a,c-diamide synthase [Planctomycetota bacterium]